LRGGGGGHSMLLDVLDSYNALTYEGGGAEFDIPQAVKAVKFYSDLYTKYNVCQPSAPSDSYRQIMEGFRTGQTGMVWHHTGSLTEITSALTTDQFGTSLRPAGPDAHIARVSYLYNGVMSDQNEQASWDWISQWGEVDSAIALLLATGYFPATSEVASGIPCFRTSRRFWWATLHRRKLSMRWHELWPAKPADISRANFLPHGWRRLCFFVANQFCTGFERA